MLFALIHCGPTLPDLAEGVNRQSLPVFWRFGPVAKRVGEQEQTSVLTICTFRPEVAIFVSIVRTDKRLGWSEADLKARRKGEPRRVELAWELRSRTTMPLAWIAERLTMGTRGHLAWLLQHRDQDRLAAPR